MATFRVSVLGVNVIPDSGVFPDIIGNQITEGVAPSIGTQGCFVMADAGSDEGIYIDFPIPKNYVGTPKLVVQGILDGAPGAAETLGFGFRKRAVANNESADGTFDAEQTVSSGIGSGGSAHADEDWIELSIDLTAGDYAVDDRVFGYVYIDASGTSYTGNFLLIDVLLQYADA